MQTWYIQGTSQKHVCITSFRLVPYGLVGLHQFCGCTKLLNVSRLLDYCATCKKIIGDTDLISISHKHLFKETNGLRGRPE